MSSPTRREDQFTVPEESLNEYKEIFSKDFDSATNNIISWWMLYIITLSLGVDEKRTYGRLMQSLAENSLPLFQNFSSQTLEDYFNFIISRLKLYPNTYTDLYSEVVTKKVLWNDYINFIENYILPKDELELVIEVFDYPTSFDFPNPYEDSSELILDL
jgi:hypothetical protein